MDIWIKTKPYSDREFHRPTIAKVRNGKYGRELTFGVFMGVPSEGGRLSLFRVEKDDIMIIRHLSPHIGKSIVSYYRIIDPDKIRGIYESDFIPSVAISMTLEQVDETNEKGYSTEDYELMVEDMKIKGYPKLRRREKNES